MQPTMPEQLIFKRDADHAFAAWNEKGETTHTLTLGEAVEQLLFFYSGGVTRGYPMKTPDVWAAHWLMKHGSDDE